MPTTPGRGRHERFLFSFRSSFAPPTPIEEPRATSFVFFFTPPRTRLTPTPNPRNIHPRGVQFVEEGTFQKQADMTRLRAKYGAAEARAILSREAAETADANSCLLYTSDAADERIV